MVSVGPTWQPRAMVTCPNCQSEELELIEKDQDDRRHIRCNQCQHQWWRGEARPRPPARKTTADHRAEFATTYQLSPRRAAAVDALKQQYLVDHPHIDDDVEEYWARYQQIFSPDGLRTCAPRDLKDFANNDTGAHPGNMSVFNTAWNHLGDAEAARRTRSTIEYLLYGPEHIPLEDRLTHLIDGPSSYEMRGFKEALLTKVLCIMQPQRFVPILIYTSPAGGKREIAKTVFGLDLPAPDRTNRTIGRLVTWSNDLLVQAAGDGFDHLQQLSAFLWWAKDQEVDHPSPSGLINHTGKYRALWKWLRDQRAETISATFTQIESILGMPLPPSSRSHVQHWHSYEGSAVTRAIHDAGWQCADVNLTAERVTFIRR